MDCWMTGLLNKRERDGGVPGCSWLAEYPPTDKPRESPMKTYIGNLVTCLGVASRRSRVPPALIAGLGLMLIEPVTAQTFTTLYSFTATSGPNSTNSDGANPRAGLILWNGVSRRQLALWHCVRREYQRHGFHGP